jgi:ring-1,2-phenylacetyl-CoA epoxidase subunit PaaD
MSATAHPAATRSRVERAWDALSGVPDPELPALSVCDLGLVREVIEHGEALEVVLTPTSSACPATAAIEREMLAAIERAGLGPARVTLRRVPAWSADWISEAGRRKLFVSGVMPPGRAGDGAAPVRVFGRKARRP